ncbi:MAG: hypothetical protein HYY06_07605 [Deltaproteobacteria bacterium]|nr:hypothetical protein [Deltaproteobacteria bacterium]
MKRASRSGFAYQNRMGDTYFLHEGRTKTGKPRYFFAKTTGEGAVATMPKGFEVSESINGVVSVRRKIAGASAVPEEDVKVVELAVGRHSHLRGYMVRALDDAVVVFEPYPRPDDLRDIAQRLGGADRVTALIENRMKRVQYAPVMKFEREGDGYRVLRMTYRGKGGWSWPLATGKLRELVKRFVRHINTDEFFELT